MQHTKPPKQQPLIVHKGYHQEKPLLTSKLLLRVYIVLLYSKNFFSFVTIIDKSDLRVGILPQIFELFKST